jgi:prepilin-type processing-associated H-X9-DG protein
MTTTSLKLARRGLTILEVLVVLATLLLIAGLVLPFFAKARARSPRINCVSSLKQVGLDMRMFSNDHNDKFPWAVPTAGGGSLEYATTTEVFRHFTALSNELITPKLLACSSDLERQRASAWDSFSNTNLSYFAGLDADQERPQTILSGDRNLSVTTRNIAGVMLIKTNDLLRLLPGFHRGAINLAFADGSVQQVIESEFQNLITNTLPARLAIP